MKQFTKRFDADVFLKEFAKALDKGRRANTVARSETGGLDGAGRQLMDTMLRGLRPEELTDVKTALRGFHLTMQQDGERYSDAYKAPRRFDDRVRQQVLYKSMVQMVDDFASRVAGQKTPPVVTGARFENGVLISGNAGTVAPPRDRSEPVSRRPDGFRSSSSIKNTGFTRRKPST